jgi:hypothetical protein
MEQNTKQSITIFIKNKTNLMVQLEKLYYITYYKPQSFLKSLFTPAINLDIYFHQGSLTPDAIDLIQKAKIVIVNAIGIKKEIASKIPSVNLDKIEVIYPYIVASQQYEKEKKIMLKEKFNIKKEQCILFFTAKDLNTSGISYLIKILNNIHDTNIKLIVESSKPQIDKLRLQLNRMKLEYEVELLSDYDKKDELFILSDFFVYPTKQKLFIPNVLKAMYYRNIVFIPKHNYTAEVLDPFSVMHSLEDPSTSYKIDSLLSSKKELKQIQKQNEKLVTKFTLINNLKMINYIINKKLKR